MNQRTIELLFAFVRSAISGTKIKDEERESYSPDMLEDLLEIAFKHDMVHMLVYGLKQNNLISKEDAQIEKSIFTAVYRYERLKYEYENVCNALENAQIPFIPLKGSVIRKYYPESWMRTSCDIDVLVKPEDLEKAISYLSQKLQYVEKGRATHDVLLASPIGVHVELHFDLVEEGRANNAIDILSSVWNNVSLHENYGYWHEMSDEFFYFYHIAHMAKHFETGGCGVRPFVDLWILDNMNGANKLKRDELLLKGGLSDFANTSRTLNEVWFGEKKADELISKLQDFILHGGLFGSVDNRVALQQKKKGGRLRYFVSRVFISYAKLKRYYPILEKHRWLMPVMQIRRWFMIFKPDVARMAKRELIVNSSIDKTKADEMNIFMKNIGLK